MELFNATEFKTRVLSLNLNVAEIVRIKNLTTKQLKLNLREFTEFKEITEANYKQVWFHLNQYLAKQDKFHRIQTHKMRNSTGYVDYSHLAYNNGSDNF